MVKEMSYKRQAIKYIKVRRGGGYEGERRTSQRD